MTTALDVNPAVADFASAVRRSLSDLGAETVDELTDGLEADLADKLADGAELGDAAAYAAELRAAAGLEAPRRPTVSDNVRANLADLRSRFAPLVEHPAVAEALGFVVSLRPVWWLTRGWAIFYVLEGQSFLPQSGWGVPLLIGLLVTSVQWGRERWLPWRWSRGAVVVVSAVALLLTPMLMSNVISRLTFEINPADYIPGGLLMNGNAVSNIFAYDANGEPLADVQLFDQTGNPLHAATEDQGYFWDESDPERYLVPSDDVGDGDGWNVYPLEYISSNGIAEDGYGVVADADRRPVPPPFTSVRHLIGYGPLGDAERESLETLVDPTTR